MCTFACVHIRSLYISKKIYRRPAPWMTDEIKREMEYRDNLRKTCDRKNDDTAHELYKI